MNSFSDLLLLLPGRTKHSIVGKAFAMKIVKSKLFHDSGRSVVCSGKEIGFESRFIKKMSGWNKGMKQIRPHVTK
jgi:hypothetical protein